ncbi:MAG: hypothetical protein OWT27_08015 [Firmicutes bacterium]|nr:hypothetical protein [Bacillota bacterium]
MPRAENRKRPPGAPGAGGRQERPHVSDVVRHNDERAVADQKRALLEKMRKIQGQHADPS